LFNADIFNAECAVEHNQAVRDIQKKQAILRKIRNLSPATVLSRLHHEVNKTEILDI
jgi:hypothetical protein